jgi:hypothetical protein
VPVFRKEVYLSIKDEGANGNANPNPNPSADGVDDALDKLAKSE